VACLILFGSSKRRQTELAHIRSGAKLRGFLMFIQKNRKGLPALKARVMMRGLGVVDKRSLAARSLVEWKAGIVNDLGGPEAISKQQETLVELACRTKLMLEHIDSFILAQKSIVQQRKKSLYPVVRERGTLANSLVYLLAQLGLERKPRRARSLQSYLEERSEKAEVVSEDDDDCGSDAGQTAVPIDISEGSTGGG
jgi:hypothetical protein